jgi:hypothetical protein
MTVIRIVCAAALLFGGSAAAQEGGKAIPETIVSLGTATPGGGFPVYGAAFTAAMQAADPAIKIEPRNTKGSTENIPLLEAGQLDLGLVAGEPAYEAFMGIGRKPTPLKIFSAISSNPGMFVVRADSPYRSIRDLVGKPVAFGAKGSGLPILARYVLDGLGLDQEKDFTAVYLDRAGDGPAMVLDGRVAALWGAGIGWPGFKAMKPRRRPLRRAGQKRDRPHPDEAHFPQADAGAGGQLSASGPADRLAGVVEFCAGPRRSARRCRLPFGEDAARRRSRSRRAPAAGEGDDGSQHRGCSAAHGTDPSRRAEVFQGDRGGEVAPFRSPDAAQRAA